MISFIQVATAVMALTGLTYFFYNVILTFVI